LGGGVGGGILRCGTAGHQSQCRKGDDRQEWLLKVSSFHRIDKVLTPEPANRFNTGRWCELHRLSNASSWIRPYQKLGGLEVGSIIFDLPLLSKKMNVRFVVMKSVPLPYRVSLCIKMTH
jgi:hypothetical protein